MFWSGETIEKRLSEVIFYENGNIPDSKQIDCAAYTLKIGPEIFITPENDPPDTNNHTKRFLEPNEPFTLPMGQFAFLLTEESVSIPNNTIGLISFKAKQKYKGLINVSGFHVDPGFKGRLLFSIYNAGPKTVHLKRGMEFFLIWFANLDQTTEFKKNISQENAPKEINIEYINNINGDVYSPMVLKKKIQDLKSELDDLRGNFDTQIETVKNETQKWVLGLGLGLVFLLFAGLISRLFWEIDRTDRMQLRIEKEVTNQINKIK